MNNISLVGRLTKDIELRQTKSGTAVIRFTLAVSRNYKNKDGIYEADFLDIQSIGVVAENTAKYCKKGDIVGVKGRLEKTSWEDKEGNRHYDTYVRAENISFINVNHKNNTPKEEQTTEQQDPYKEFAEEIQESDLPF